MADGPDGQRKTCTWLYKIVQVQKKRVQLKKKSMLLYSQRKDGAPFLLFSGWGLGRLSLFSPSRWALQLKFYSYNI